MTSLQRALLDVHIKQITLSYFENYLEASQGIESAQDLFSTEVRGMYVSLLEYVRVTISSVLL